MISSLRALLSKLGSWKARLFFVFCILGILYIPTVLVFYFSPKGDGIDVSCAKQYSFTSRLLDCGEYEDSVLRLQALSTSLKKATDQYQTEGRVSRVSVWVRNLETKRWASINETELYTPGSLLKVPLMIAYYKFAEVEPSLLTTSLTLDAKDDANKLEYFTPPTRLTSGRNYSVSDLIKAMIVDSDNNASLLLYEKTSPQAYQQTMIDLGLQIPKDGQIFDFITVKSYANIFRMLYNASYLNRELSNKALDLMSQSSFKGIATPIPSSIKVAHKFGERTIINPDGSVQKRELLDCGIVYKDPNPYSLCIMTEGDSFDTLLSVIKDISSIVYEKI